MLGYRTLDMDTLKTEFDISEQRIATIQEKGLLHSLIFVASRFKRLQAIHVEKCYDHLNVLMKPYSPDLPLLSASVPCDLAHTRRLSQWITDENKLEQVRNRQAELQHLESSVNELNALVEDLNGLLQIQDIHIDSVENYAEVTEHQLNEGNRELGEAEHFSKRIQWAKLVSTFIVIFLICGIVGLILAITLTNNNSRKK
ncbi:hypothetical protein HMI56_003279 [Coelomomyces lativittatus]|nr:hypothetical protein HMI56_003279 [Coelomomyces lativittatus]